MAGDPFQLRDGEGVPIDHRVGTGAARHRFCRVCGIKSFHVPRRPPEGISVNARCLDEPLDAPVRAFDGRNWEQARPTLE